MLNLRCPGTRDCFSRHADTCTFLVILCGVQGVETLRVIERQQAIAAMYASEKSIMETAGRIV